jgi:hypothetical protein
MRELKQGVIDHGGKSDPLLRIEGGFDRLISS